MSKAKIDYALSVLDNEIQQQKKVRNEIDLFNLELIEISSKLLRAYKVMLLDNNDTKELDKIFVQAMKKEYIELYKKHCMSNIKID